MSATRASITWFRVIPDYPIAKAYLFYGGSQHLKFGPIFELCTGLKPRAHWWP